MLFFKEINSTGILVGVIALLCFVRNVFFPDTIIPRYPLYPYRMNGNFIRCSMSYFGDRGKSKFFRSLFFNLVRVTLHEMVRELVMIGKLDVSEIIFVTQCAVVYTIIFYFMPFWVLRYLRFVWAWLMMEF